MEEKYLEVAMERIDKCLAEEIELEGGVNHPIEELEELRLLLKSVLNRNLLDSLLHLYRVLNEDPKESEIYSWFARNSLAGSDCKYALASLKRFKEKRLDKLEPLLEKSLESINKIREAKND